MSPFSAQHQFINRLRILRSIDRHEVPKVFRESIVWERFNADPYEFLMRCDDETADAIWYTVLAREQK